MLVDKNMREHHSHFDTESWDHKVKGSMGLDVLAQGYLEGELQNRSTFFRDSRLIC